MRCRPVSGSGEVLVVARLVARLVAMEDGGSDRGVTSAADAVYWRDVARAKGAEFAELAAGSAELEALLEAELATVTQHAEELTAQLAAATAGHAARDAAVAAERRRCEQLQVRASSSNSLLVRLARCAAVWCFAGGTADGRTDERPCAVLRACMGVCFYVCCGDGVRLRLACQAELQASQLQVSEWRARTAAAETSLERAQAGARASAAEVVSLRASLEAAQEEAVMYALELDGKSDAEDASASATDPPAVRLQQQCTGDRGA